MSIMPHNGDITNGFAHSPDDFSHVVASLNSLMHRLVATTQDVKNGPIVKIAAPKDVGWLQDFATPGEAHEIDQVINEAFAIFDQRLRVNHPRFMGLIPSPTSPVAWIGDVIASAFNALGASKFQASGPVAVEKKLVDWLGARAGLPEETRGGVFVSGGSMANLMALVMARDRFLPPSKHDRAVAYLTTETHFSVVKAVRLLGFVQDCIRRIRVDDDFRMDCDALQKAIEADLHAGLAPFVVVATCGTTNTGAVDPMESISEICKRHDVWMHVDGAYGASVALSAKNAQKVTGLAYADSISWDAHKWLFQTYSCGILLVRDRLSLAKSLANSGDYLRDGAAHEDPDIPNFWDYSMELTRPAHRAMKLWFTLRVLGIQRIVHAFGSETVCSSSTSAKIPLHSAWMRASSVGKGLKLLNGAVC